MARFIETNDIISAFAPVDMQTAANTGDWISMKNWNHVTVVVFTGIGTAGDDATVTVEQATSIAGASNKALNFTTLHAKRGATALSAVGTWTKVTQGAANTYTHADDAENESIWVIYLN